MVSLPVINICIISCRIHFFSLFCSSSLVATEGSEAAILASPDYSLSAPLFVMQQTSSTLLFLLSS